MEQLTKRQQELAEVNHNLLYKFASQRNLPLDDYYDILAIGLCRAAKIYDENRGAFSSVAYRWMENEMKQYWRHAQAKSSIPEGVISSCDVQKSEMDGEDKRSLLDGMADDGRDIDELVTGAVMAEAMLNLLTDRERRVAGCLLNSMTYREIASQMKCTKQNVQRSIHQIRRKWASYLTAN